MEFDKGLLIKELTLSFSCPDVANLDIHALRATYAELMDQAADVVHAAGLEQDDCILERSADVCVQPHGEKRVIEVDMLSDRQRCIRGMLEQCVRAKGPRPANSCVAIERVRLRIIRGPSIDPFGLASPHAGVPPE